MATERIKRALELARAEREGRNASVAPLLRRGEPAHETVAEPAPRELTGRFLRTRQVAVSPEVLRKGRLLSPDLQGTLAQSFRMLRTQVLQRLRARGWNSVAVLSATPDEGKTTVALNLAMAIAMDPMHSALLVDFDLRKPRVARRLGLEITAGVEDALTGNLPVEPAFVRLEGYDRLMILPAAAPVLQSSELLTGAPARRLAEELKSRYPDRIIVYDLPPLLGADDAIAFLPNVDAVLLVVAEGRTKTEHLQRAFELLKDKPIVGTVLNQSRGGAEEYYPS